MRRAFYFYSHLDLCLLSLRDLVDVKRLGVDDPADAQWPPARPQRGSLLHGGGTRHAPGCLNSSVHRSSLWHSIGTLHRPGWFLRRWQNGVFLHRPATASCGRGSGATVTLASRAAPALELGAFSAASDSLAESLGSSGSSSAAAAKAAAASSSGSTTFALRRASHLLPRGSSGGLCGYSGGYSHTCRTLRWVFRPLRGPNYRPAYPRSDNAHSPDTHVGVGSGKNRADVFGGK